MPSSLGFALNTQNFLMRTNKQTHCTASGIEVVYSSLYRSKSNNALWVIHQLVCLILYNFIKGITSWASNSELHPCSQNHSPVFLFPFFLDHTEGFISYFQISTFKNQIQHVHFIRMKQKFCPI